jgi:hypothetical protein
MDTYLLDEEPSIDSQRPVEDAEHEESAPADVVNRIGSDLRKYKVKEPLRCSTD